MLFKLLQLSGFIAGGAICAYVINVLLLRFSRSLGIRNKNNVVVRWSNESKPSLGGVSFFVVFIFSAFAYSIIFRDAPNIFQNIEYIGLFLSGSLAFAMGLADDAYDTRPLIKLLVQIFCGVVFVWTDTLIDFFHVWSLDVILTILWVIIIMNSLNMLDNMDGITGITTFWIILSCMFSGWILLPFNINIWILFLAAILGSVIGFLIMNKPPSKLFMGDAGSQFIGLFISFVSIKFLWNIGSIHPGTIHPSWLGACVVLVAFTPAAVDTLTVVINRLKKGQSPMVGGKDHTTHHLVYAGLSEKKVWFVFLIIGLISTLFTLAMVNLISLESYLPVAFFIFYPILIFWALYKNTIKYPAPNL